MNEGNYIRIGVHGVPRGEVRLTLDDGVAPSDVVEAAVAIARLLADEYRREFRPDPTDA